MKHIYYGSMMEQPFPVIQFPLSVQSSYDYLTLVQKGICVASMEDVFWTIHNVMH